MVKVLNRDKIQRMVDGSGGNVSQGAGSGSGEGVSQAWVNANFVSIAYFEQLFKAYKPGEQSGDPDVEVKPNTIDADITNIKAMFGFWTEQYISALGQGSGGGGGGGASALTDLVDVNITSPSDGQVLMYDGNGHWINGSISMSGYATQAWVQSQGYLTSSSAASTFLSKTDAQTIYLSKTDAQTTYLSKTDAANTYLSIAFFSRLFQAYNGSTAVNPNDTTSTIDSIKAMFGFWTEQYISALGQGSGGGGGGASALGDLVDVTISSPSSGQVLMYDGNGHWINGSISMSGYATQAWVQQQGYATQSYLQQNYLPLSGGTLTGMLYFNQEGLGTTYIGHANSSWMHFESPVPFYFSNNISVNGDITQYSTGYTWIHSGNIGSQSVSYSNNAGKLGGTALNGLFTDLSNTNNSEISMTIGGVAKTLTVGYASNAGSATYASNIYDSDNNTSISVSWAESALSSASYLCAWNGYHIGNIAASDVSVGSAAKLTTSRTIWGQSFDGSGNVTGNLTLGANNYLFLTGSSYSNGSYIIGRSGGIAIAVGGASYEKFAFYQSKFYANAEIEAETGVYSHGYVTALSDVRLKKIIDRFTLKPEAIALASLIHYTWKDGHDKNRVHVGGIAQEWQEILPEAVHDIDGRLTMDYGVIGMVSAVSLAKTVIEQEKRIKSLEERLAAIEAKLK